MVRNEAVRQHGWTVGAVILGTLLAVGGHAWQSVRADEFSDEPALNRTAGDCLDDDDAGDDPTTTFENHTCDLADEACADSGCDNDHDAVQCQKNGQAVTADGIDWETIVPHGDCVVDETTDDPTCEECDVFVCAAGHMRLFESLLQIPCGDTCDQDAVVRIVTFACREDES